MSRYTADTLVQRIRRRAFLPTSGGGFTDADILGMADEALDAYLVPLLLRVREEWLVTSTTYTLVSGTSDYAVPSAAIGGKTRLVQLVSVKTGEVHPPLPRLEPEQVPGYWFGTTGEPRAFVLEDNKVRLHPTPTAAAAMQYTLRVSYHRQPAQLCLLSQVLEILSVAGNVISTKTNATGVILPTQAVDLVAGAPPFGSLTPASGLKATPAGMTTTVTTPTGGVPVLTGVAAGDFLCPLGLSPVPQVPAVTHALVAFYVAEGLLKASDPGAANAVADERQRAEAGALTAVSPRTEGNPRRITNGFNKWRGGFG